MGKRMRYLGVLLCVLSFGTPVALGASPGEEDARPFSARMRLQCVRIAERIFLNGVLGAVEYMQQPVGWGLVTTGVLLRIPEFCLEQVVDFASRQFARVCTLQPSSDA